MRGALIVNPAGVQSLRVNILDEAGQAAAVCGTNREGQLLRAVHRGKSGLHRVG